MVNAKLKTDSEKMLSFKKTFRWKYPATKKCSFGNRLTVFSFVKKPNIKNVLVRIFSYKLIIEKKRHVIFILS